MKLELSRDIQDEQLEDKGYSMSVLQDRPHWCCTTLGWTFSGKAYPGEKVREMQAKLRVFSRDSLFHGKYRE